MPKEKIVGPILHMLENRVPQEVMVGRVLSNGHADVGRLGALERGVEVAGKLRVVPEGDTGGEQGQVVRALVHHVQQFQKGGIDLSVEALVPLGPEVVCKSGVLILDLGF